MDPHLTAIAAAQGGVFTAAQASACGYARAEIDRRVRDGAWLRLRRGVFIEAVNFGTLDDAGRHVMRLRAALLQSCDANVASHITAAIVHGLPVLGTPPAVVHLTRDGANGARTESGVTHHRARLEAAEVVQIAGLPVTIAGRAVIDVARTMSFDQAVVIADAALQAGAVSPEALHECLAACAGWPGVRRAARVAKFARVGAESPGESVARIAFAREGLPPPCLQASIFDCDGLIGRVDYLWEEEKTIGEFDGRIKYDEGGMATVYAEKRREDRLREAGYEVVRFGWTDVQRRPQWIAARVRAAFARHHQRQP